MRRSSTGWPALPRNRRPPIWQRRGQTETTADPTTEQRTRQQTLRRPIVHGEEVRGENGRPASQSLPLKANVQDCFDVCLTEASYGLVQRRSVLKRLACGRTHAGKGCWGSQWPAGSVGPGITSRGPADASTASKPSNSAMGPGESRDGCTKGQVYAQHTNSNPPHYKHKEHEQQQRETSSHHAE